MLDKWVFILASILITIAEIQYISVLLKQYKLFKTRSMYQPLKRLLFAVVVLMIVGAFPLLFVYLNIVWFHYDALWIVYVAVLGNAGAKVAAGVALNLVYNFRSKDDDDILY